MVMALSSSGLLLCLLGLVAGSGEMTIESAPPVVVKTVPESGTTGFDPKTTEIRVVFSKAMVNGSWSWNKVPEAPFPKTTGEPRFEKDMRTCVLPVNLQPGKTYALWLNSPSGGNFRDVSGHPAVSYLLIFKTRGPAGPTETRDRGVTPKRSLSNLVWSIPVPRDALKLRLRRRVGLGAGPLDGGV